MKKLIFALALAVSLTSCSTEDTTPDYTQTNDYKYSGKTNNVTIQVTSNVSDFEVEIYDFIDNTNDVKVIYSKMGDCNITLPLDYKSRYILNVGAINGEFNVLIKNNDTKKIIDTHYFNGCSMGYVNNFIVL